VNVVTTSMTGRKLNGVAFGAGRGAGRTCATVGFGALAAAGAGIG